MPDKPTPKSAPVTIKKYANRRLYNTASSSYVTLEHLARMVKDGEEFVVFDAKSGDDITRQVLTHIIVEEEGKGQNLLPIGFLRHVISFYGDSLQGVVPRYLEESMKAFARNQEQMRDTLGGAVSGAMSGLNPFGPLEELSRANIALFESAFRVFQPPAGGTGKPAASRPASAPQPAPREGGELDDLRAKLSEMQRQLDGLAANGKD